MASWPRGVLPGPVAILSCFLSACIGVTKALPGPSAADAAAFGSEDVLNTAAWSTSGLQPHFPVNISGHYKGKWQRVRVEKGLSDVEWLQKDGGLLAFHLSSSPSLTLGVHDVEGDLLLRDSMNMTEEPEALKLAGVYVAATGHLHARMQPVAGPISVSIEDNATQPRETPEYRQALRNKASLWTSSEQQPPLFYFLREDTLRYMNKMEKECELVLDLSMRNAKTGNSPDTGTGGRRKLVEITPLGGPGVAVGPLEAGAEESREGDVIMKGTLSSPNCGVVLSLNGTTTHIEEHFAKAINYTLMITAVSFLQVLLLIRQMEATSAQAAASKVSLLMLGQQAIMDAHLCLLHLTTGIVVEPLFNAFATTAFFEFVVFAIFEMRYLLSVWRARRANAIDPWAAQRELSVLYARFYGALLGGIFLTYQLQRWMKFLIFPMFSFWVPQIVCCARHNVRQPLRPIYIVGITVTRLALPLYVFGCPRNILRVAPAPWVCIGLCTSMGIQVALLLAQTRWGPQCFIPRQFLPAKYDYHRQAAAAPEQATGDQGPRDIETGDAGVECVICMNPLDVARTSSRMVTPCGHFFHINCLNRWMDVKMECPTCRRPLPPP